MAYEIPGDYVLPAGRILIQADPGDEVCVGTIVQIAVDENWGCFRSAFRFSIKDHTKLRHITADPEFVPNPEPPYGEPGQITVDYTKLVFNRESAQEVKIGETDYFIICAADILALIPT